MVENPNLPIGKPFLKVDSIFSFEFHNQICKCFSFLCKNWLNCMTILPFYTTAFGQGSISLTRRIRHHICPSHHLMDSFVAWPQNDPHVPIVFFVHEAIIIFVIWTDLDGYHQRLRLRLEATGWIWGLVGETCTEIVVFVPAEMQTVHFGWVLLMGGAASD